MVWWLHVHSAACTALPSVCEATLRVKVAAVLPQATPTGYMPVCKLRRALVCACVHFANHAPAVRCMWHCLAFLQLNVSASVSEYVDKMDLRNAMALQYKILQARSLFYLSETAIEDGAMSFEELWDICRAGHIDSCGYHTIVKELESEGQTGIDFLNFLAYLPMFIHIHKDVVENPLEM